MEYTLKELESETCRSFGGSNCVLHQCMFGCALREAKLRAIETAGITSADEINKIWQCHRYR